MIDKADVVVVGSGALGGSTALWLARAGLRVALLDRRALASETSPRAAGLSAQLRPGALMTRLAVRAVALLMGFEADTGLPIGLQNSGSLKLARGVDLASQLDDELLRAREFGVAAWRLTPAQAREKMPLLDASDAEAINFYPGDVYLDPALFTRACATAAERAGCVLLPHTAVREVLFDGDAVRGVATEHGTITADIVVDAAGAWARALTASGAALPMLAVRHQLLVTRPLAAVRSEQPITRVLDANVYVRPCDGGLMLGGYESAPMVFETPPDSVEALPLDLGVLQGLARRVTREFPVLRDLEGAALRGGLPTMTLDDEHLIGPVPGLHGLYVIGGCNVGGLSTAPAFAEALTAMILDPARERDVAPLLPSRFAAAVDPAVLHAACTRHYAQHYWSAAARAAA